MADDKKVLHALDDHYAGIFGEEYSDLYRKHVAGRRLAHDMTIEEYRANPVIVSFGGEPGPEVGEIREIEIPVRGGEKITCRLYYPEDYDKDGRALPAYVNYHGGGWVIGNIGDDDSFLRTVVKELGCIVVDVGYRLAPEYRYPTPILDSWQAYEYVAKNAQSLGIDSAKLAVGGFSAGGHIAAVVSQLARDKKVATRPCFQLLVIPVCDATALDTNLKVVKDCPYSSWAEHYNAPFLSHARMSWFYKYFLPTDFTLGTLQDPLLSPLRAETLSDLPPALVVPAEVDVLREEGIAYARRLAAESGSWVELWLARRVPHPFPHQVGASEVARQFRALAVKRLGEAFDGKLTKRDFISNV